MNSEAHDLSAAEAAFAEGVEHYEAGRLGEALASYELAARLAPGNAAYQYNLGNLYRWGRRFPDAIAAFSRALELNPRFAVAHHNRAQCRLQLGDFEGGFAEYEWRKLCPTFDDPRYRRTPQWTGEDLSGRSLFIYPELFLGDMLQFCRYAVLAERAGARVMLGAPEAMHAILRTMSPTLELLSEDAEPDADAWVALMSLPAAFRTSLRSTPWAPRYLAADPERVARWRDRIGTHGLRVGIAWQSRENPPSAHLRRSFPLAAAAPLAQIPGIRLISLQKFNGLDQLDHLPPGMNVETLGEDFDPGPDLFLDTAAAMLSCDLVVTPDTSVVHLAGALGVETWLGLLYVCDWRWLDGVARTPWYPSVRLFRQPAWGDWDSVFQQMAQALMQRPATAGPAGVRDLK
jgi:hypothetical protein